MFLSEISLIYINNIVKLKGKNCDKIRTIQITMIALSFCHLAYFMFWYDFDN